MTALDKAGLVALADRVRVKSWKITRREHEADPFAKKAPAWARDLMICGYAAYGWRACEQPSGKTVASGDWGDSLVLLPDGSFTTNAAALRAIAAGQP